MVQRKSAISIRGIPDGGEELHYLSFAIGQVVASLHVMEMDVAFDPIQVGPFRVNRVMMQPDKTADLLQQPGRLD